MSEREKAIQLIKEMPENKMIFVVKILRDIKGLPAEENEPDGSVSGKMLFPGREGREFLRRRQKRNLSGGVKLCAVQAFPGNEVPQY